MSTKFPVVSVVIPMYNVAKYIPTSLESVLSQSFQDFEVICVDDGCTDQTLEVVNSYQDPRIRVISQTNRGLAGARNTGINSARGIFVALLDADDFWATEKLSYHINHLYQRPMVGISYGPSLFVDEDGKALGIGQFPKLKGISSKDVLCRNPIGNGSAPVIRRTLLLEIGAYPKGKPAVRKEYFDERLRQSEDIEFWLRVALKTHWTIEGIPKPLTYYRVNASGLSANLEAQLQSWESAMTRLKQQHNEFFAKWYGLAKAYQLRYLARRAIQSRNPSSAIKLSIKALCTHFSLLKEEPLRTLTTLGCAFLCLLPTRWYERLEQLAMTRAVTTNVQQSPTKLTLVTKSARS